MKSKRAILRLGTALLCILLLLIVLFIFHNKTKDSSNTLLSAEKYNRDHTINQFFYDPWSAEYKYQADDKYESQLNEAGDGIMGRIEIQKIGISYPIYHGTENSSLEKGIGHLEGTSLPVGGRGTHAVLAGHRGTQEQELFARLGEMDEGDTFILEIAGQSLTYEVCSISICDPMQGSSFCNGSTWPPEKEDYWKEIEEQLAIDPEEDYVTLLTNTPLGVNSQRLLVRGKRVK